MRCFLDTSLTEEHAAAMKSIVQKTKILSVKNLIPRK